MNFKKIEVYGFKSFADKLQIQFEKGITAIVGPNGCGKSNVADSIRWVLGEQSAKTLRGGSMQDVIFNGTQNRKSLSYCEVSLFFDNADRMFDIDYNEVSITRKLYRSGESAYFINKKTARLKDIVDLLHQAGLGKDSYSIIGQGKIESILSSKPGDRRAIFEEATGIAKAKSQKLENERKLARTRDNIVRLTDIVSELERQIGPLKSQSENAKKYNTFRDELRYHELNYFIYSYDGISARKKEINTKLEGISQEIALREIDYFKAKDECEKCIDQIGKIDSDLEILNEERTNLMVSLEKSNSDVRVANNSIEHCQNNNIELQAEIHRNTDRYAKVTASLTENDLSISEKSKELAVLRETQDDLQQKLNCVSGELTKGESDSRNSQSNMFDSMNRLSEIQAEMSGMLAEKNTLITQKQGLEQKLEETSKNLQSIKQTSDALQEEFNKAKAQMDEIEKNHSELLAKYKQAQADYKTVANNFLSEQSRLSDIKHEQNRIMSLIENDRSNNLGTINILKHAESDSQVKNRIEGVVSRMFEVPEKYEKAIEAAMGGALQNVIAKTREDAKYLIEFLKQRRLGFATFLPLDYTRPRYLSKDEQALTQVKGFLGVASDLVKYDKKFENVYLSLLGKTVVVEDLDSAIAISKKGNIGFQIVTLDGDMMRASGAMSGGSKKMGGANVLERERLLKTLQEDNESCSKNLQTFSEKKEELEKLVQVCYEEVEQSAKDKHKFEIDFTSAKQNYLSVNRRVAEIEKSVDDFNNEIGQIKDRIAFIDESKVKADEFEMSLKAQKQNASEDMKKFQEEFDLLKKKREEIFEAFSTAKLNYATCEAFVLNIQEQIKRLKSEAIELDESIKFANDKIKQNTKQIEEFRNSIESGKDTSHIVEKIKVCEGKVSELTTIKINTNAIMKEADGKREQFNELLNEAKEKRTKIEVEMEKIDFDMEEMRVRVAEEYGYDYDQALPFKDDNYVMSESETIIRRIKRQISALGSVNVNAIEQYKEVGQRYEELSIQRDDLDKAEKDLLEIIKELTTEMVGKFNAGFEKINENFMVIFKELFGGGNAKLELIPSENGDRLDDGVEIFAEPPGKKLQSISLLSGGERALTAIAILFGILRLSPMPFCVLDEIEAALDDANADRFARYLHKFSTQTQFIVITHRKPTMELADALYGVTMEEKGVSKMISVKLSDAVKLAEPAGA